MDRYYIFDHDRHMFWKSDRSGYTPYVREAGIYTEDEMNSICTEINVADCGIKVTENPWIKVDSYLDVPEGLWLVKVDTAGICEYHVMQQHKKASIIGHHFARHEARVVAYKSLGDLYEDS